MPMANMSAKPEVKFTSAKMRGEMKGFSASQTCTVKR